MHAKPGESMRTFTLAARVAIALTLLPATAIAQVSERTQDTARGTGVSAIWILANLSYAGMRAQNNSSTGWRVLSFIFGFPGTLLSFFVVTEGSERAYGVDLPRRASASPSSSSDR
jgi:heme/copper-type cytochrome/quinol oxidase subunit 4